MALGPQDELDRLIVQKYAQKQMNKAPVQEEVQDIDPDTIILSMNNYSLVSRCMFAVNEKLISICSSVNAANVSYSKRVPSRYINYIILLTFMIFV